MSMINVVNLTFAYEGSYDDIFENVSFQIDTDWKLGFIGRNGRGKTTFLNLLLGKYEYSGTISSSVKFEYFPYEVKDKRVDTLDAVHEICPECEDWEVIKEISLLDVDPEVLYRPFETLSNGEQTKVLLAALFCGGGRFLLIDEPTNHLDVAARKVVGDYLKRKKGFILVSHDRALLDKCVDHILSINKANIEIQSGNFSSWYLNKQMQDQYELAENEKLHKEIGRLSEAARRASGWSDKVESSKYGQRVAGLRVDRGYVGHKSAKMMKRAKQIESRQQNAIEEKSKLLHNIEDQENLEIRPLEYFKDVLVDAKDLSMGYGDWIVCSDLNLTVHRGDRIALNGKNGCGKSTLLKLILENADRRVNGNLAQEVERQLNGRISPEADQQMHGSPAQKTEKRGSDSHGASSAAETSRQEECLQERTFTGTLSVGSRLKISYISQDTSHLKGSLTDYAREKGIEESVFKSLLRKLGFERVQFEKDMADFSGGQKKKVLIAGSLCEQAHLYLWDEPLNFIDLFSRMQIEELILQFQPTMIFVEHDGAFREKVATRTVEL